MFGGADWRSAYPICDVGYVGTVQPLGTLGCRKRLGEEWPFGDGERVVDDSWDPGGDLRIGAPPSSRSTLWG